MPKRKKTASPSGNVATRGQAEYASSGDQKPLGRPDWDDWICRRMVNLSDAVALSCNIDPNACRSYSAHEEDRHPKLRLFIKRLHIAEEEARHRVSFRVKCLSAPQRNYLVRVNLVEFATWAVSLEKSRYWRNLPKEFKQLVPRKAALAKARQPTPETKPQEPAIVDASGPNVESRSQNPTSADERKPTAKDKPVTRNKRRCLLRTIVALAKANSINPDDITVAADAIEKHTQTFGKPVSASAIRHYLHSAMDLGIWPKPAGYRSGDEDEPRPGSQHDQEETRNLLTVFVALAKTKGIPLENHGTAGDSVAQKTVGSVDKPVCTKTIQGYIRQAEDLGILPKPKGPH